MEASVENPSNLESIKAKLHDCGEQLDLHSHCVEKSVESEVPSSRVEVLLKNSIKIFQCSFQICIMSAKLFETVIPQSQVLFQRSSSGMRTFYDLLTKVVFNEYDALLILEVIDDLSMFISNLKDLETSYIVATWKVFARVAYNNRECIKEHNPSKVINNFEPMAVLAKSSLTMAVENNDASSDNKQLHLCAFLVSVLQKMCESYSEYLNDMHLYHIVDLLVVLNKYQRYYLSNVGTDERLIDLVTQQLTSRIDPFVAGLVGCSAFKKMFIGCGKPAPTDNYGYYSLTIRVMRQVLHLPSDIQYNWIVQRISIVDVALEYLNLLSFELAAGEDDYISPKVVIEGENVDVYKAAFDSLCDLIYQVQFDDFEKVEEILLKHLMSNKKWSSMMSLNVWFYACKLMNVEMVEDRVRFLLRVYKNMQERRNDRNVTAILIMTGRLFQLLPDSSKIQLFKETSGDPLKLKPLRDALDPGQLLQLCENSSIDTQKIEALFNNLKQQPSTKNLKDLISYLERASCSGNAQNEVISQICRILSIISENVECQEGEQLHIFFTLLSSLVDCSKPQKASRQHITQFLRRYNDILPHLPTHVHLKITNYLLTNKNSFGNDNEVHSVLAELHFNLLKEENPLALNKALDCFNRISKVPSNHELMRRVASAIKDKPEISQLVSSFVTNEAVRTVDDFPAYFERIVSFEDSHVCAERAQMEGRQDKVQKMSNEASRDFNNQQEAPPTINNRPTTNQHQRQEVRVPSGRPPASKPAAAPRQQQNNNNSKQEDPDDFVAGIISDLKRAVKMKSKMDPTSLKQLKVACAKFIDSEM